MHGYNYLHFLFVHKFPIIFKLNYENSIKYHYIFLLIKYVIPCIIIQSSPNLVLIRLKLDYHFHNFISYVQCFRFVNKFYSIF